MRYPDPDALPPDDLLTDISAPPTERFDLWAWRRRFVLDHLAPTALAMFDDQPEAVAVAVLGDCHYNDEGYTRDLALLALTEIPADLERATGLLGPAEGADGAQGAAPDDPDDRGDPGGDPGEASAPCWWASLDDEPEQAPARLDEAPARGWWASLDDEPEQEPARLDEDGQHWPADLTDYIQYQMSDARHSALSRILEARRLDLPESLAGLLIWGGGESWRVTALLIRQPEARTLLLRWVMTEGSDW